MSAEPPLDLDAIGARLDYKDIPGLVAEVRRLGAALADNEAAYVRCNARAARSEAEVRRLRALMADPDAMRVAAIAGLTLAELEDLGGMPT